LVFGILGLLAAFGLVCRWPWGRVLLFVVAILAVSAGACWRHSEVFHNVRLGTAQLLFGTSTLAILSISRLDPVGINVFRLVSLLVSLCVILLLAPFVPDWVTGFLAHEGISSGDVSGRFLDLTVLSGSLAGLLIVTAWGSLLVPRLKRFAIVSALMIAAACGELAMAAFALLGCLLGRDLLGGYLLVFFFPGALVLLLLTAVGVWYLRRPTVRSALGAR
jgi:hypothetical protein